MVTFKMAMTTFQSSKFINKKRSEMKEQFFIFQKHNKLTLKLVYLLLEVNHFHKILMETLLRYPFPTKYESPIPVHKSRNIHTQKNIQIITPSFLKSAKPSILVFTKIVHSLICSM